MIDLLSGILLTGMIQVADCDFTYKEAVTAAGQAIEKDSSLEFTDYSGENEKKLLEGINAEPPTSHWTADHILVFQNPENPPIIALSENGCLTKMFKIPREDWIRVRQAAIGDPS